MTKFCPSCYISQEPYIIWLLFMVDMYRMMIFPGIFFFNFSKFWFSGLLVGWKGKKWPGMTKNSIRCAPYFRNHTSYDCHFWVCLWAKNAKMTQSDKILSVTLHISGSIHHMIVIFGTHVQNDNVSRYFQLIDVIKHLPHKECCDTITRCVLNQS